jgi:hypothetical protein
MKVERWPGGDFELEPGDMVRIRPDTRVRPDSADCAYGTLAPGAAGAGQMVIKIPSDAPPAMFLGEVLALPYDDLPRRLRLAQVLLEGQIVNVSTLYVEPVK